MQPHSRAPGRLPKITSLVGPDQDPVGWIMLAAAEFCLLSRCIRTLADEMRSLPQNSVSCRAARGRWRRKCGRCRRILSPVALRLDAGGQNAVAAAKFCLLSRCICTLADAMCSPPRKSVSCRAARGRCRIKPGRGRARSVSCGAASGRWQTELRPGRLMVKGVHHRVAPSPGDQPPIHRERRGSRNDQREGQTSPEQRTAEPRRPQSW